MTTFDLFERAERIEAISAEIYATLARQFQRDPDSRALFERLEAEEHQHASRIRLFASQYRANARLRGKLGAAGALESSLAQASDALAAVKAGAWGTDLRTVKTRLVYLEAALSKAHAQALAEETNPGLRDFFQQLAAQDAAHVALLKAP